MKDVIEPQTLEAKNPRNIKRHIVVIWVVSIPYILIALYTFFSHYLIISGSVELGDSARSYYRGLGAIDFAAIFGAPLFESIAAFLLLFRKKQSYYFWVISIAFNSLSYFNAIVFHNWLSDFTMTKLSGIIIRFAALIAIAFYCRYLTKRNILTEAQSSKV